MSSTPQNSEYGSYHRRIGGSRPSPSVFTPIGPVTRANRGRQEQKQLTQPRRFTTTETSNISIDPSVATVSNTTTNSNTSAIGINTSPLEPEPTVIMATHLLPPSNIKNFEGRPGDLGATWLADYKKKAMNFLGYNENKVNETFPLMFAGPAQAWYNSLSNEIKDDANRLKDAFEKRFDGSDGSFSLDAIKQKPSESVCDYYTRYLELSRDRGMPTQWLVTHFIDGLHTSLKKIVKPQDISTLDDARRAATRAEQTVASSETTDINTYNKVNDFKGMETKLDKMLEAITMQQLQINEIQGRFNDPSLTENPYYQKPYQSQFQQSYQHRPQRPQSQQYRQDPPQTYSRTHGGRGGTRFQGRNANQNTNSMGHLTCFNCNGTGHKKTHCPSPPQQNYQR